MIGNTDQLSYKDIIESPTDNNETLLKGFMQHWHQKIESKGVEMHITESTTNANNVVVDG